MTRWLDEVLSHPPLRFDSLKPSTVPEDGGVYLISDHSQGAEEIVYVGLTGNLRRRVCSDQLHGDAIAGTIKPALVHHGRAKDIRSAKEYMRKSCGVRFAVVPDYREREMREGFAKAVLKPQFSLYKSKEH